MSGHLIEFQTVTTDAGDEIAHLAACICGSSSGQQSHQWEAEDWGRSHLASARRARAALGRTPSLRNVGLYYRQMADDPEASDKERADWTLLAEEIETRIANQRPLSDEDQLPLF